MWNNSKLDWLAGQLTDMYGTPVHNVYIRHRVLLLLNKGLLI